MAVAVGSWQGQWAVSGQPLTACRWITGQDENYQWDRAFIVRKEAQEALDLLGAQ